MLTDSSLVGLACCCFIGLVATAQGLVVAELKLPDDGLASTYQVTGDFQLLLVVERQQRWRSADVSVRLPAAFRPLSVRISNRCDVTARREAFDSVDGVITFQVRYDDGGQRKCRDRNGSVAVQVAVSVAGVRAGTSYQLYATARVTTDTGVTLPPMTSSVATMRTAVLAMPASRQGEACVDDSSSCIWCVVLIVLACLLIMFVVVCAILIFRDNNGNTGSSLVQPLLQNKPQDKTKFRRNRNHIADKIEGMAEILSLQNKNQMVRAIEAEKYTSLMDLSKSVNRCHDEVMGDEYDRLITAVAADDQGLTVDDKRQSKKRNNARKNEKQKNKKPTINEQQQQEEHQISTRLPDFGEIETELDEEETQWRKRLEDFPTKFQAEMSSLIAQRHQCVTSDCALMSALAADHDDDDDISDARRDTTYDVIRRTVVDDAEARPSSNDDQNHRKLAEEYLSSCGAATRSLYATMRDHAERIEASARRREEQVTASLRRRARERRVWNEMANELVELIHDAERRNFITTDERSELVGKTIRQLTSVKSKFTVESDRFFATMKRAVDEKASALRANRLEYDAEGETGSDTKLRKFENRLENQRLNESKLDEMALEQHKQYDDVMTQVRKSIEAATEIVKSTLLNCGTDQIWLEDMLQKMNDDLRIFEEELNKEAGSPAIKSSQPNKIEQKRQREFLHSMVTNEVIGHVRRLQPFMSADERMCVAAAQVDLASSAIRSVVREHVSNRLAYLARAFDKKQAATRAVKERGDSDEAEIRRELSEKLAVWTEEKAKPKHWSRGAVLRDADTRALSSVLRRNLEAFSQTCEVKRERRAGEVLLMTSLRILLSSKRIRSPECKVILQEHKSQCEKVEIDFAEEKLRREDDLRRKTQTQLLHKSAEKVPDRRTDMTCYRIGEITDRLIENTSERSDQEREALQNLLKLHNSVYAEKQKSLLEQEILLTRNLARLGDFKSHDVLASLRCLLPTKNDKYLEALSSAICAEPVVDDGKRKKKSIDIFKEDESKPLYLHIKQILLQEQAVETSHNSHLQHERYEDEMMDDYQQLSIRNNEPDSYPDMYSPYNSRPASSRDFRPASSSSRDPARPASSRVRGGKTRGHKKGMNLKRTTASR